MKLLADALKWGILVLLLIGGPTLPTVAQVLVTQIAPLPLAAGPNRIDRLSPDGRSGVIMLAWWSSGTASGSYNQYTVTLQDRNGWAAVGFEDKDASEEERFSLSVHDYPHVGEDTIRAVRFARALVNGRPQVVLFIARRNITDSYYDPVPTTIEFLVMNDRSEDAFGPVYERAQKVLLPTKYCNAETALSQAMGLPKRPRAGVKQTADGC